MDTVILTPSELGKRGGLKTKSKYGSEHFRKLQALRKNKRGKYSKNDNKES